MSRIFLLIGVTVFMFFGCKKKVTPIETLSVETEDTVQKPVDPVPGSCYIAVSGKDSVVMQVVIENNSAIGKLHYRFAEKDKSGGTIFGSMRGDTLIADYKFMSEGKESEREVAFLKRGDVFIEGYGEIVDQEGRMVFRNTGLLKFEGWPMKTADCAALMKYFQD